MKEKQRKLVDIKKIKISKELKSVQGFMPMSSDDYNRLRADIKENGLLDAVVVYERGGLYYLLGGLNRLKVSKELGLKNMPVVEYDIVERDRELFCINNNLSRRHFSSKEKQRLIKLMLERFPDYSSRKIGRMLGVSNKSVSNYKNKLRGEVESTKSECKLHSKADIKDVLDKLLLENENELKRIGLYGVIQKKIKNNSNNKKIFNNFSIKNLFNIFS